MEKVINGSFQQNAYVVWSTTHSFIIDPGGDSNRIIDIIKSNGDIPPPMCAQSVDLIGK